MRENFLLVIGAVKAGTTTLYEVLKQHKNISMASIKETNFFFDEENWSLDFYLKNFSSLEREGKILCDVDPRYLYYDIAPKKIKALLNDDVRFVVILRNPADRAFSHYLMDWRNGEVDITFEQAIEFEINKVDYRKRNQHKTKLDYIDWSLYSKHIKKYFSLFEKDRFLFLLFEEDIRQNLQVGINKILEFVELDPSGLLIENFNTKVNVAYEPRIRAINKIIKHPLTRNISALLLPRKKIRKKVKNIIESLNRKRLIQTKVPRNLKIKLINEVFKEEIEELQELTGLDLSLWYKE